MYVLGVFIGSLLLLIALAMALRHSVANRSVICFSAMFSRFMNTGSQFVMEGVKNLVVGNKVSRG